MQQIGQELRGQTIDPLDPGLRSRILATVREMTPGPAAPVPSRRPALVWGGTAFAALLLVAVFASRPLFAPYSDKMAYSLSAKGAAEAPPPATSSDASKMAMNSPVASPAPMSNSAAPAQARGSAGSSFSGTMPAKPTGPMYEQAKAEKNLVPADESATQPQSFGGPVPQTQNYAGNKGDSEGKKIRIPSLAGGGRVSDAQDINKSQSDKAFRHRQEVAVVSPAIPQTHGESFTANRKSRPQEAPVLLERAGFDLDGYQFVTQSGQRVAVPFLKSLNAVRFARATDGRMALAASAAPPILYLAPADTLVNDAIPGSRWQPLPPGVSAPQPLYVHPAQDWEQFLTMRWYPNMTVVGGLSSTDATSSAFAWLPGSHVQIGPNRYSDFAAYRAFADAHPEARRLRAAHDTIPMSPVLPTTRKAPGAARGKAPP
ncbi:MAG: hypothetical protein JWN14_2970 [Chthonomonadales bacterium]|nr:hypothetical protein [Chthonomonadales bacterium]